jgi:hypothetical protein
MLCSNQQAKLMSIQPGIPIVAIYNNLEVFFKFLQRSNDHSVMEKRMYRGDRGIFWLGPDKLLVVTKAIPHAEYICNRWGYSGTSVFTPREATHQLSLDIMYDADLSQKIARYADTKKRLQLVPYAATPEFYMLVEHLRTQFDLNITLVESPAESNLWIRDYIDTKAGFRSLVSEWIPEQDIVPHGFICRDVKQAAKAVHWFNRQQLGAVAKADGGESGLGHIIFPVPEISLANISSKLEADLFLRNDLIVVDQLIGSETQLSPSLELFVPADGGTPLITYVSSQLFSEFGHFSGVLISRELTQSGWYPRLVQYGLQIAKNLQAMGYVGHFDIDAVVGDNGHLYLLEINARRTGGTYVHEFATLTFGQDYLDKVSLLCNNSVKCGEINKIEDLIESLDDLLFPVSGQDQGIVITVTSSLSTGEFGCILIAQNEPELMILKQKMFVCLEMYSAKKIHV